MSIIRVKKDKGYFTASNKPFNDARLSWESRGLMGYLLSKPDNWECRNNDLINQGPAGEHKIKRMLRELKDFGYVTRNQYKDDKGYFYWMTDIHETPINPSIGRLSTDGSSTDGSSTDGKPPYIVSTESINTESINTETGDSPSPKKTPKPKKQKPSQAIEVYRNLARRYPSKTLWPEIDEVVGSNPESLNFWNDVIYAYIGCGWNKMNVKAMLEFFKKKEIPTTNGGYKNEKNRSANRNSESFASEPTYNPFSE